MLCVECLCADVVSSVSVLTVIIHRKLVLHCQYASHLKVCHCLLPDMSGNISRAFMCNPFFAVWIVYLVFFTVSL